MIVKLLHQAFRPAHLALVKREMMTRGAPTIRATRTANGIWIALEGSHRLRAALALGLTPAMVDTPWPKGAAALARALRASPAAFLVLPEAATMTPCGPPDERERAHGGGIP